MNSDQPKAFPSGNVVESFDDEQGRYVPRYEAEGGMELRDFFASQAARQSADIVCDMLGAGNEVEAIAEAEKHARAAYIVADAMLAARKGR